MLRAHDGAQARRLLEEYVGTEVSDPMLALDFFGVIGDDDVQARCVTARNQ